MALICIKYLKREALLISKAAISFSLNISVGLCPYIFRNPIKSKGWVFLFFKVPKKG
jgi:hypothetical protein